MAKKVECGKFLVIEVSGVECIGWGGAAICDFCNETSNVGYYIAVLNSWYCPKCFKEWKKRAKWYPEDANVERSNYAAYAKMLGIE